MGRAHSVPTPLCAHGNRTIGNYSLLCPLPHTNRHDLRRFSRIRVPLGRYALLPVSTAFLVSWTSHGTSIRFGLSMHAVSADSVSHERTTQRDVRLQRLPRTDPQVSRLKHSSPVSHPHSWPPPFAPPTHLPRFI
jgi:hypothetical protein